MGRQLFFLVGTKENRLEQEERTETARMKSMKQELEWVRSNPKGRHAKSKARMTALKSYLPAITKSVTKPMSYSFHRVSV